MHNRMNNPVLVLPEALKALHALDKATEKAEVPHVTRNLVLCARARSTAAAYAPFCTRAT